MKVERDVNVTKAKAQKRQTSDENMKSLEDWHKIYLPDSVKNKRKLLRNAVWPEMGLHVFNAAQQTQGALL